MLALKSTSVQKMTELDAGRLERSSSFTENHEQPHIINPIFLPLDSSPLGLPLFRFLISQINTKNILVIGLISYFHLLNIYNYYLNLFNKSSCICNFYAYHI